jgi:hypothetical protein
MKHIFTMVAMTGAVFVGIQALAADPASPSPSNRRQLASCMTKQMSASRTISYNEATKVCKDQLKSQNDRLAANDAGKPVADR